MTYRSDLDALSARHAALEHDVAAATRDRDRVRQLLDEARAGTERTKLPLLAAVRVASPCSADWSGMTGDDRVRSCGACQQMVYNLSGMTRPEAEALIVEREGKLCVRYYRRADGTILFADCSAGVWRRRHRRILAAALGAGIASAAIGHHLESRPLVINDAETYDVVMGEIRAADVEPINSEAEAEASPGSTDVAPGPP
jgi:hypothetical protein